MKKLLLTSISLTGLASLLSAQVIETFNYTPGAVGSTAATGTGLTGNYGNFWISNNVSGSSEGAFIVDSLAAPSGYGYTPSNNRIAYDPADSNNNSAAVVEFATASKIDMSVDGTYYVSFLIRAFNNNGTSSRLSFQSDVGTTLFTIGELNAANDDPNNGKLGIDAGGSKNFSTGFLDGGSQDAIGTDNLVVLKISTSAAGVDSLSASFWNSASGSIAEEPSTWNVTHSLDSAAVASGLRFDFEDGFVDLDVSFDEIRIGTSFSAVTGISNGGGSLGYVSVTPVGGEVIIEFQVETTTDLGTPFSAVGDVTVTEPSPGVTRVTFPSTEPQLFLKLVGND